MRHFDEHILELYALGSEKTAPKRAEIEAHLQDCAGCRELVRAFQALYGDAEEELASFEAAGLEEHRALPVPVHDRRLVRRSDRISVPIKERGLQRGVRGFVGRHPVASTVGAFSFGAASLAALLLVFTTPQKKANPSYYHYNLGQEIVEIRSADHQKLWEFPSSGLERLAGYDYDRHVTSTCVADINGDGSNEVITTLPVGSDREQGRLRAFDSRQALLFERSFVEEFQYRDRKYSPQFRGQSLLVLPQADARGGEIMVLAAHDSRSPSFLARVNNEGSIVGEYWHFGRFTTLNEVAIGENGKKLLALTGGNDTGDTAKVDEVVEFPVVAVIDPAKIVGRARSSSASGFSMPASDAEGYYIRLPISDIDSTLKQNSLGRGFASEESNDLCFLTVSGREYEGLPAEFEFHFDRNMAIREVKTTNKTETLHARLRQQGKLTSKLDKAYLENLKNGVRYWDGAKWCKEPTRVSHRSGEIAGK